MSSLPFYIYLDGVICAADDPAELLQAGRCVTYDDIRAQLESLPPGNGTILLEINSPGGNLYEGYRIYNLLRGCGRPVEVRINGFCGSIATLIAMAGYRVHMNELSRFCVHNPFVTGFAGDAAGMEAAAAELRQMERELARVYAARTGRSETDILALMAKDTPLSAAEALSWKFVDEISAPITAYAYYRGQIASAGSAENHTATVLPALVRRLPGQTPSSSGAEERPGELPSKTPADLQSEMARLAAELASVRTELEVRNTELQQARMEAQSVRRSLTESFGTALNLLPASGEIRSGRQSGSQAANRLLENFRSKVV